MPTPAELASAALTAKEPYGQTASAALAAKGNYGVYASANLPAITAGSAHLATMTPTYAEYVSANFPYGTGGGVGPVTPQTASYDFTAAMPALFDAAYVGPTDYSTGYPVYEDMAARWIPAAIASSKIVRRDTRGLRLEPAVTNIMANSRQLGAVAATLNSFVVGQTLAIGSVAATQGSNIYVVTCPSAHGRATGDRIYFPSNLSVGGRILSTTIAMAFTITVVSTTVFHIVWWQKATSTGTNAVANSYNYQTWNVAGTFPTGQSVRGDSGGSRVIRMTYALDPNSGGTPFSIGSLKNYNISGVGTEYLILGNFAAVPGDAFSFSQITAIWQRRSTMSGTPLRPTAVPDEQMPIDNFGLALAFIEKDAGGVVLRETVIDSSAELSVNYANLSKRRGSAVVLDPACTQIDIANKFTGSVAVDIDMEVREMMVSKTRHCASLVLPAWNTSATASKLADTCAGIAAPFALKGADYVFECKEIVASTDTIISFGTVELRAVGTTWPRDLVLTDGTNSVTLAGQLRDLWPTQQIVRASMSWGAGGLRLSMTDDFLAGTRSGSNATFSGAAQSVINLNEASGGARRGMTTAKGLTLYNTERTLADVIAASRLTYGATFAVPGVDTAVGRTSVAGLTVPPGGAGGTFSTGNKLSIGASTAPRVTVLAGGSAQTYSDVDLRGVYFSQSAGSITDVTFSQSLFDAAYTSSGLGFPFSQNGLTNCANWIIENSDFYCNKVPSYLSTQNGAFSLTSANPIVRKVRVYGSESDLVALVSAGTIEDSILVMTANTASGAHADGIQFGKTDLNALLAQRNLIDFRKVYGHRLEPNTGAGGSPAPTADNWYKSVTLKDTIVLGGYNTIDAAIVAPSATSVGGVYHGDCVHVYDNVKVGVSTNTPVSISLDGAQLKFVGGTVAFAQAGGRAANQNCLGLITGTTWPDGHRGGALKTTALAGPATLTTQLGQLATPMIATDAFTITVSGVPQTITVFGSGASGNNQINTTDTLQTLITKIQALFPALTVTLEDYRLTKTSFVDYFSGAAL